MKRFIKFALILSLIPAWNSANAQSAQSSGASLSETTSWITNKIMSYGIGYETKQDYNPYDIRASLRYGCGWEIKYEVKWNSVQPKITAYSDGFVFVDKYSTSYLSLCRNGKPTQEQAEELSYQATWRTEQDYNSDIYTIKYRDISRVECNQSDRSITIFTRGYNIDLYGNANKKDRLYIKFDFSRETNLAQRMLNAFDNLIKLTTVKEAF